ncbi:glutathione transferase [Caenorhabditis elegans]|uniref:glutathione transferase n=1 Tax=Caenorhabditis elegans TaxID=6239 RepID=Q93700_CAEEL|nr:Glutathione S-transferase [Caenorhabditis elegans]CAB02293.1 Glutathione S-transferase [Caenorhabditis elegans]|eukprot:NP_496866.1 Glutathione S-Transferase [Caenorhabditis elegans]
MPSYKLTYFSIRGLGEPIRHLFHLAGVSFEDERLAYGGSPWEQVKEKYPMSQLSAAILRYLGRKFGFAGKTPEEEAWVDAVVDLFKDFLSEFKHLIYASLNGKSADEIERVRTEIAIPARNVYFKNLNDLLKRSKSGFLIGDGITFADIVVTNYLETLKTFELYNGSDEPKLVALQKKVYEQPGIKECIATRVLTEF